jgi:MoaD family protein
LKVRVKGYLLFKSAIGNNGELELEVDRATVKDVLVETARRCGKEFKDLIVDPTTGMIKTDNLILVNGRNCRLLENGMSTFLKDGSTVAIFPPVAGG